MGMKCSANVQLSTKNVSVLTDGHLMIMPGFCPENEVWSRLILDLLFDNSVGTWL